MFGGSCSGFGGSGDGSAGSGGGFGGLVMGLVIALVGPFGDSKTIKSMPFGQMGIDLMALGSQSNLLAPGSGE